jgi:tripartite-type tricarboxylate transporter receptor subunit TctC
VPVATPPGIVARLNVAMNQAMADAATRKSLLEGGTEPVGGSDDEFAKVIRQDSEKYERLAKELRIKAE